MVEKTSDKFLGKTTKFLGFKRKKKIQPFLGQKSCEKHINSDCFQFILRCEESEKYLQLQKMKKMENLLVGKDEKSYKDLQCKK